ncbi:VanZ family protein [[Clostridium] aminophilum]|uniref:VanZ family protein n=1 Tax=[Clostridium] aminophilum TaxID=1526 RepID=UPI003F990924
MKKGRIRLLRPTNAKMTVLWMGIIFLMSATAGPESDQQSGIIVDFLLLFLNPILDGMDPSLRLSVIGALPMIVRKAAHMTEYAVLAVLACRTILDRIRERKMEEQSVSLRYEAALLVSVFYACTDEFHQTFVAGRAGCVLDVLIDASGACAGLLAWYLHERRRVRMRKSGSASRIHA